MPRPRVDEIEDLVNTGILSGTPIAVGAGGDLYTLDRVFPGGGKAPCLFIHDNGASIEEYVEGVSVKVPGVYSQAQAAAWIRGRLG